MSSFNQDDYSPDDNGEFTMYIGKHKPKIAVVDDDESILEICQIILESENYEVETHSTGKGIYALQRPLPDLVLLDVLLADEDGREICTFLKQHPQTSHIPVILFSAHAKAEIKAEMPEGTQPDKFMTKPFEIEELVSSVQKLLIKPDRSVN